MGFSFDLWLSDTTAIDANGRAAAAWKRINDKPSSVAFKKTNGAVLNAQTVRLEWDSQVSETEAASGATAVRKVTIFGIRDHATLANTDMQEGYRFVFNGDEYRVMDTILTIGEIQGIAQVTG